MVGVEAGRYNSWWNFLEECFENIIKGINISTQILFSAH